MSECVFQVTGLQRHFWVPPVSPAVPLTWGPEHREVMMRLQTPPGALSAVVPFRGVHRKPTPAGACDAADRGETLKVRSLLGNLTFSGPVQLMPEDNPTCPRWALRRRGPSHRGLMSGNFFVTDPEQSSLSEMLGKAQSLRLGRSTSQKGFHFTCFDGENYPLKYIYIYNFLIEMPFKDYGITHCPVFLPNSSVLHMWAAEFSRKT